MVPSVFQLPFTLTFFLPSLMFIKMETHGKFESYLVASSDIDLESAIRCAYDLGSADRKLTICSRVKWMVLCFTGKQVNTSYSSEQMLVMLFLCNSLDSHRRSLDPDKIILDQTIFCEKEGRKKVKVKGSWTTEGTVRFEYDSLFCQDQETYGVYFQNHYCLQWWRCWQATQVHCELLIAIPVITQSLKKSRQDLDTDIRHPKSYTCTEVFDSKFSSF
jgi:hypothetical protein